ncbi:hypothetical protein BT67DRAFT_355499, partial [Trichocladium antarcticum]
LHQPAPRYPRPAVSAASAGDAPDVYWDDRESRDPDANLAQYTFYREGTPTPPEHDSRDRGSGHGRLAAPVAGNPAAGGAGLSAQSSSLGCCWSLALPLELEPVSEPAGPRNRKSRYNSDCPALNNTVYHVPGSTKRFLRLCGIDYSGSGATDLAHVYTGSMADCIHACASFDQCTSCSWGYLEGDAGSEHRCYMKKELKTAHEVASDWCLAVL